MSIVKQPQCGDGEKKQQYNLHQKTKTFHLINKTCYIFVEIQWSGFFLKLLK